MNIPNLSPECLNLITVCADNAREAFLTDGNVAPCIVAMTQQGGFDLLPLDGAPKEIVSTVIHRLRQQVPVVFIAEAWTTHMHTTPGSALDKALRDDPKNAVVPAPAECPDRTEAVMVQFHFKERHIVCIADITRATHGAPSLGKWRIMDNNNPDEVIHKTNFSPPGARLASGITGGSQP